MVTDYWEKCGTSKGDQSYTIKGVPCQSSCEMKKKTLTEDYWWCKDNDQDPSSWDYCSPPGQVLTLMNKFKLKKRETGAACPIHKAWACLSGAVRSTRGELLVVFKVPQVASSLPKPTCLSPDGQVQTTRLRISGGSTAHLASTAPGSPFKHCMSAYQN